MASQARHELGARGYEIASRYVVPQEREKRPAVPAHLDGPITFPAFGVRNFRAKKTFFIFLLRFSTIRCDLPRFWPDFRCERCEIHVKLAGKEARSVRFFASPVTGNRPGQTNAMSKSIGISAWPPKPPRSAAAELCKVAQVGGIANYFAG